MKKVNPFYLDALLNPLSGLADDDDEVRKYQFLDSNNELQVKEIIRLQLKPYFLRFDEKSKAISKLSLSYYLSTDRVDFERVFNSCLLPFDSPTYPKQFFVWLWEEFFGNEPYQLFSYSEEVVEERDIHTPNTIRLLER